MESLNWRFYANETQWTQLSEVPYTNIVAHILGHMWSQWESTHSGSVGVRFLWSTAMTPCNLNFTSRLFHPTRSYPPLVQLEKFLDHRVTGNQ